VPPWPQRRTATGFYRSLGDYSVSPATFVYTASPQLDSK